ncbi:hypothetical protein AMJ80_09550 [bacterium SM23_31]|nr:MAG: hypothetical protein AMJ80_09550 [bacterium SM23_31]
MKDFEKIVVLENEVEASLMESILKERNIPHRMRTYHDLAYNGLFQFQKGWGHVEAPNNFKDEILTIYEDLKT